MIHTVLEIVPKVGMLPAGSEAMGKLSEGSDRV